MTNLVFTDTAENFTEHFELPQVGTSNYVFLVVLKFNFYDSLVYLRAGHYATMAFMFHIFMFLCFEFYFLQINIFWKLMCLYLHLVFLFLLFHHLLTYLFIKLYIFVYIGFDIYVLKLDLIVNDALSSETWLSGSCETCLNVKQGSQSAVIVLICVLCCVVIIVTFCLIYWFVSCLSICLFIYCIFFIFFVIYYFLLI